MRSITLEHHRLIFDSKYRTKMRPIVTRARNWRGRANNVRINVIHNDTCCSVQPYEETERAIWTAGNK